jgi:hypothetical protein
MPIITTINTESAKEFWDLLSPERPFLPRVAPEHFLYRGQRNSEWHLTPSLFRKANLDKAGSYLWGSPHLQIDDVTFFEFQTLRLLIGYCDETGLPIPHDSPELRESFDINKPGELAQALINPNRRLPARYHPVMALAQHYGLPTRLLDWTRRSCVAAYFAASDAMRETEAANKRLAVWAFNTSQLHSLPLLDIIGVPPIFNKNLVAQAGRFIMCYPILTRACPMSEEPFQIDHYIDTRAIQEILWKITLPINEAPALMNLCQRYAVSAATMFPDYYGVVRHIEDDLAVMAFNRTQKGTCRDTGH